MTLFASPTQNTLESVRSAQSYTRSKIYKMHIVVMRDDLGIHGDREFLFCWFGFYATRHTSIARELRCPSLDRRPCCLSHGRMPEFSRPFRGACGRKSFYKKIMLVAYTFCATEQWRTRRAGRRSTVHHIKVV